MINSRIQQPRVDHVILIGNSRQSVEAALRDIGVPPAAFLRHHVTVAPADRAIETTRGLECAWACAPDTLFGPAESIVKSALHAGTRHPEMDFHELIARRLAWRMYHEQ